VSILQNFFSSSLTLRQSIARGVVPW
jgi:hypothetical protein